MTSVRSFQSEFEIVDYTEELVMIPNQWGLVNSLGLFENVPVAQHSITVESTEGTLALISDKVRGERNTVNKSDTRSLRSFPIPHFPLDDYISPNDVQGKRAYGSADASETEAAVIMRKMDRIRKNWAATVEAARCQAITAGTVYAPNGTVVTNYYTDFGITQKVVSFDLVASTDVIPSGEEVIAHIQDNILSGESVDRIIGLCSPTFFAALIANASVKDAYKYYTSVSEPLRNRLSVGLGQRTFEFGGITYIEYRGAFNGTALIPAGDAYFIPTGTADTFMTYFSPANKFEHVNTLGEEQYMWTYRGPKDDKIEVQTESNFMNLIRRPQAVVRGTLA